MSCSSSCKTQDHATWGECVRAKSLRVTPPSLNMTAQKAADKNLDNYAQARKYGIQPKSTNKADVDQAVQVSEQTGVAFQA